ncbi:MAG: GGDEF domain-containing protein [Clostridia bacterium]|nr:GGDEF domain-containing protein [Clostridia bacterium]
MNQLSTTKTRRGIPLIVTYLFVSIVAIVFITGSILGAIRITKSQSTEIEVNNLYDIAEIQIAAQYNSIVGDALNIEALTRSYVEEEILYVGYVRLNLERIFENFISNTGKYAAVTYVQNDGYKVSAGKPKDTTIPEFMINAYESEAAEAPDLYAYISEFNHSDEVKEVTFTVTVPMKNNRGEVLGYVILEPYLDVIIKDVRRALANANIKYEMLEIQGGDAVYIYSDIDKARGAEAMTLSEVQGTDVGRDLIYSDENNGNFASIDGQAYYQKFQMPVSNYYGERHTYVSPGTYVYILTLPTAYYNEKTQIEKRVSIMLGGLISAISLAITILLYIAQNNRRKLAAKTTKMAQVDTLTGLLNRAYFTELFEGIIEQDPEAKYAILFMDLDGFKDINDSYGHNTGDKVLRVVANRLVMAARREDLVSRFGGDEFAMLISYNSVDQIRYVANKVVRTIDEVMIIDDNEYHVGVSVGVAIYPDHARSVDDLYKVADNAMYKVKYSTKNAYFISKGDDKVL